MHFPLIADDVKRRSSCFFNYDHHVNPSCTLIFSNVYHYLLIWKASRIDSVSHFGISQRMRNETTRSKSKGILAKSSLAHEVEEVRVPEVYRLDVQEKILCRVSDDDQCISVNRATVNGEYNATHLNADSTFIQAVLQSDVEQNGKNGGLVKDISQEQVGAKISNSQNDGFYM